MKYLNAHQDIAQSTNDFVAYVETLKIDLKLFTKTQKRNHFLHKLRKNLRKKMITSQKLSKTRDEIVALTQRYEIMISFKSNFEMKLKDEHKFDVESRVIFKKNSFDQRIERSARKSKNRDKQIKDRDDDYSKTSRENDNDDRENVICYNCEKSRHVKTHCFDSSKKNSQINAIEIFEKTLASRRVRDDFDDAKN